MTLTAVQLTNARTIFDAAWPFGRDATKAALMTALAESSLLRYANDGSTTRTDVPLKWRQLAALSMRYPHDAVAGSAWTTADSVGWFQQRPMMGYCTSNEAGVAELMSPESVRIFIRGSHGGTGTTRFYLAAPYHLTIAQRCQWAQGSEYPTGDNYAPHELLAEELIARLAGPTKDGIDMAELKDIEISVAKNVTAALDSLRDALPGIVEAAVDARINAHFGAAAVTNPKAALNAGLMPRLRLNLRQFLAQATAKPAGK